MKHPKNRQLQFDSENVTSSSTERKVFEFADELSVIGFRYCFDKSRSATCRIGWAILVVLGFISAMYQIVDRGQYFFSYPTSTDINIVQANSLTFPQVTFCNENIISKYGAAYIGLTDYFTAMFPAASAPGVHMVNVDYSQIVQPNISSAVWEFLRTALAQSKDNAVVKCFWGEDDDCTNGTFRTVQTNMGQCIAFNAADFNYTSTRAGSVSGLSLLLHVNQLDYLVTMSPSAGFRVLVHDSNEIPLMLESAFKVTPGYITSVSVAFDNVTRMEKPYGDCRSQGTEPYYQKACDQKCKAVFVVKRCQCRLFYMSGVTGDICNYNQSLQCANTALQDYQSDKDGAAKCNCPTQCNTLDYQVSISQAIFSKSYLTAMTAYLRSGTMLPDATEQYLMDNMVILQIFFSSMQYMSITTNPGYSFLALLSDVGGALGLLLGATLYTFVEILEFLWGLAYFKMTSRLNQSNTNKPKITPAVIG